MARSNEGLYFTSSSTGGGKNSQGVGRVLQRAPHSYRVHTPTGSIPTGIEIDTAKVIAYIANKAEKTTELHKWSVDSLKPM